MVSDEEIRKVCELSLTMAEAASKLKMHFNTFKKRALKLGCYKPNQGGKGTIKKSNDSKKFSLLDILEGNHPQYQSNKLRKRLIEEGIKQPFCEICGISEWNGKRITLDLHHIDGNSKNHNINNLLILCPNCHSQTETYKSKNTRNESCSR